MNEAVTISGKQITLDLNGKKLSSATDTVSVLADADVTIKNGTLESSGKNCGGVYAKNATAKIEKCTVNGISEVEPVAVYASNGAVVTIKDSVLTAKDNGTTKAWALVLMSADVTVENSVLNGYHAASSNGSDGYDQGKLTIKSGSFNGQVYWPAQGKLTINGGEIDEILMKSGSLEITAGNVGDIKIENVADSGYEAIGNVAITGGTFTGAIESNLTEGFITGGTFTSDVSDYVAPGYMVEQNNNGFGVVIDPSYGMVAKIGNEYYETLEKAIAAAAADPTITYIEVLCDYVQTSVENTEDYYDITGNLIIGAAEKVTLSGCGFAVRVKGNGATLTIHENVTIEGLDVVANGFGTQGDNMVINGTIKALSLKQWTSNGTITVSGTGSVWLGYGDGQFDMAYGNGTVTIEGTGDKTNAQFKAGYSGTRGNGNTLNLNNTYFEAGAWFNIGGSNGIFNVNNSQLKVSGGDAAGSMTISNSGNVINLIGDSELAVATLTLGEGNTINLGAGSKITSSKISGAGKIVIDATGMTAGMLANINADMTGFTGTLEVINNPTLTAKIDDNGKIVLERCLVGAGTETDPYMINNVEELILFRDSVNAGETKYNAAGVYVVLGNNIDLGGATWKVNAVNFKGIFDGNDKTISNFHIDATAGRGAFFYKVYGATVKDLTLSDITASVGKNQRVAALTVGYELSTINNVTVKNFEVTTTGATSWIAGLACSGYVNSEVTMNDCTVENFTVNDAYGAQFISGISAVMQRNGTEADGTNVLENLKVKNFKVNVNGIFANGSSTAVGGLIGQTQSVWQNPHFKNCTVTGLDVTATGRVDVGGFMAHPGSYTYATNCTVAGKIDVTGVTSSANYAGGFFGDYGWGDNVGKGDHKVTNCTVDVDIITNVATAGGFIGSGINTENKNKNITLTNCEANGTVSCVEGGTATIGGFVGYTDRGAYNNCTAAQEPFIGKVKEDSTLDNTSSYVAIVNGTYYADFAAAMAAAEAGDTITLVADIALSETITNTKKVTLDLNGKTITGTDNATGSFSLITNKGELTIKDSVGNGKITLTATNNRGWNAYSSVISNTVGGKLIVESGTIEHLGGTDMAYGIDNLTNGKGTYAETIVNGGTVKSTYRAIRQFLNGVEAQNILTVNGGTIVGANKSIWMQDPSKNANTGKLTVGENAVINGDIYLFVTAGSTKWPVEVSIAASAVNGEVISGNVPAGYDVAKVNETYGVYTGVAKIGTTYYSDLTEALAAAQDDQIVKMLAEVEVSGYVIVDNGATLDLNGNKLTASGVITFSGSHIVDNSTDNSGILVVAKNRLIIDKDNEHLPIWNGEGYRFAKISNINTKLYKDSKDNYKDKYSFQPFFDKDVHKLLCQDGVNTGVTVAVRVNWTSVQDDGIVITHSQDFVFPVEYLKSFLGSYKEADDKYDKMFTLTMNGLEGLGKVSFCVVIKTDCGVESVSYVDCGDY